MNALRRFGFPSNFLMSRLASVLYFHYALTSDRK